MVLPEWAILTNRWKPQNIYFAKCDCPGLNETIGFWSVSTPENDDLVCPTRDMDMFSRC